MYFIYNLLFSVVSIRTSSLVVNCFVTVDKQNSVFLFLSFVSPRWSLKKWKYNFTTQCVIAMECLSKLRTRTEKERFLSPNFSTRDILWHQQIANFFSLSQIIFIWIRINFFYSCEICLPNYLDKICARIKVSEMKETKKNCWTKTNQMNSTIHEYVYRIRVVATRELVQKNITINKIAFCTIFDIIISIL